METTDNAQHTERHWHILTCEYPPDLGGLSDYSFQVAQALSNLGRRCFVWAPGEEKSLRTQDRITLGRSFGNFRLRDLRSVSGLWASTGTRKRIFLQWSPSGYGLKSVNLPFCLWLVRQVLRGDELLVMFHEAFMDLSAGPLRRRSAGVIQRLMAFLLLNSASRVFISTSAMIERLSPFSFRGTKLEELPIPANILLSADVEAVAHLQIPIAPGGEPIIGHFGLYSPNVESLLIASATALLQKNLKVRMILIGDGSVRYRNSLLSCDPCLSERIFATGPLSNADVSLHISACVLMFQPYQDGVTTRRGTTMAALAHKKCLVSTLGRSTEEVWKSTSAVHLITSTEPQNIAAEIDKLLSFPEQLETIGEEGFKLYQENFALARTVDTLLRTQTHENK